VVRLACQCARTALQYVPNGEDRPRLAIEAAERWADNPTESNRLAAWAAARAAGDAAGAAARAAGDAAGDAAGAAAWAAGDAAGAAAWAAALRYMAAMIRETVPEIPESEDTER
jgi:hypothetical protein